MRKTNTALECKNTTTIEMTSNKKHNIIKEIDAKDVHDLTKKTVIDIVKKLIYNTRTVLIGTLYQLNNKMLSEQNRILKAIESLETGIEIIKNRDAVKYGDATREIKRLEKIVNLLEIGASL